MFMKKYKIFVSGAQKELAKERRAIKELISENILLKEHFTIFLFEDHPAESKSADMIYIKEVNKSEIYIGILGRKYGSLSRDKISPTEREFRQAQKQNKHILIYLKGKNDAKRDRRLRALISEIKKPDRGYKYERFNTILELKNHIFESLVSFLKEKGIISKAVFDMSSCEEVAYNDIDKEKVKWFLRIAKGERNYPLNETTPAEDAFVHLNLLKNGKLTNAAVLLFGKDPQKFHIQAEVKCLHFHGTEVEKPFETYHVYKGNVFDQVDSALGFVLDRLKRPVIPEPGKATTKRPFEIPEFVIREGIVNAIAHRDYYSSAAVQIMVFIDRIEVWNPGKLPPQLTIDALKKPHPSFPHNPLICESLYLAKYAEKAGSGTVEMIKQLKENGLLEPEFIQKMGRFVTVIWRDIFTESYLARLGLNERQLKAVKYVKEKGKITNEEYQKLNRVKRRLVSYDLTALAKKGVIERIGKVGKGTHYRLAKKSIKKHNAQ